jgi:hypothetical protein
VRGKEAIKQLGNEAKGDEALGQKTNKPMTQ